MTVTEELKEILGPKGWLEGPSATEPYVTDWRGRFHGVAMLVALPANTDEVARVVAACARHRTPVVPQGGNTGLCGGSVPDEGGRQVVLSTRRMNRIRELSADDFSIVVDAGCTLRQVQQAAEAANRFFPLSLAAEGSCQIGGNLSTNAGGINVLRYGTARSQVLGLEVVLPDGRVLNGLRSLRKDTAGYDLKQIYIGAEGTLGVITGASLRLQPQPRHSHTAMLAVRSPQHSVALLAELRSAIGDDIQAFELIPQRALEFVIRHTEGTRMPFDSASPWYVLTECTVPLADLESTLFTLLESGLADDAIIAKSARESGELWHLRHSISDAQNPEGASLKHDVSVPVGCVGVFVDRAEAAVLKLIPGARPVPFGHVGDGNVHFNVSQPAGMAREEFLAMAQPVAERLYDLVAELGGSFSAEHGVGQVRRPYLARYRGETEMAVMQALKKALDPDGIMNPGKVL